MTWSDGIELGTPAHAIASSSNKRVRVVAGPGTGKSFAMKRRVARLLEDDVDPTHILAVTFTRVAAEDLHRELVSMGVKGCDKLDGATLHSLALRMLMRNHVLKATGRRPRTLNEFEVEPLFSDLAAAHGGKKAIKARRQAYEAGWARLQHHMPGHAPDKADAAFQADLIGWLKFHQAMLIGEVIPQIYEYLRSNPKAKERTEFKHILVDEYQDLNRCEQAVLEMLSDAAAVCIVGDDDQSIYSFKHAHPEGIRDWLNANPGADDLTLVDCRRCPTRVVDMANSLISHNKMRPTPRALSPLSENGDGDVRIIQYDTLDDEVAGVAAMIVNMVKNGTAPGDVLVLAQRGVIGTPIFEKLLASGTPVRSYYAEAELDKQDAQVAFALLKLLANPEDRVALRWLLGVNSPTWHAAGYRHVREHCEANGETPWQALSRLSAGELKLSHTNHIIKAFDTLKATLDQLNKLADLGALTDQLFPPGQASTAALRELTLKLLKGLDPKEPEPVRWLVRELSTAIAQPDIPTEIADVRIMSLHKSKGLSAPVTIIAGCVEGLLPKPANKALPIGEQKREEEEQRRLFYVGITRVKASVKHKKPGTLILTNSLQMLTKDALGSGISPAKRQFKIANLIASRFINECGPNAPTPVAGDKG